MSLFDLQHPARMAADVRAFPAIADSDLDALALSEGSVVLFFWAPWCGPCVLMSVVLAEVLAQTPGLSVLSVDVDSTPEAMRRYDVRNVPTIVMLRDGVVHAVREGALSKRQLASLLRDLTGLG